MEEGREDAQNTPGAKWSLKNGTLLGGRAGEVPGQQHWTGRGGGLCSGPHAPIERKEEEVEKQFKDTSAGAY